MEIYVLSHKRAHKMTTWNQLPESIKKQAAVAVYPEEWGDYRGKCAVQLVHCENRGVGFKRQWLVENCKTDKIVMLDDDLVFATRRTDDPTKFAPATGADIEALFDDIRFQLDNYVHVGVSGREGANRKTESYIENTRMMRILAYNLEQMPANIRFDEQMVMEDFCTTLHLLTRGYPNTVINWIVHNQAGSNAAGGCSVMRTRKVQEDAAKALAQKFPGLVSVVQKETKTSWGGGVRTDVRIQWRKAYEQSR